MSAPGAAPAEARQTKPAAPRGFALVVVAITGIALVSIGIALVYTAGAQRIVSNKARATDQSLNLAENGLERASAYLRAVSARDGDFDILLDPTGTIDCAATVAAPPAADSMRQGLPDYTDTGAADVTFRGKRWMLVPYAGGAYLTRFDDDADDARANLELVGFTSNRPANNCNEGPAFTTGDNPFRDRNRAVWVTVFGIFPGTDPNAAQHQTSVQQYYISPDSAPLPALWAGGTIDVSTIQFCSTVGDIAAVGNINLPAGDRCGALKSGATATDATISGVTSCGGVAKCDAPTAAVSTATGVTAPTVDDTATIAPVLTGDWFDWTSPCNFQIVEGSADNTDGLYYWDATGSRGAGPTACNSYVGPPLPPDGTLINPGNCWVPLITVAGGVGFGGAVDGVVGAEISGEGTNAIGWKPRNVAQPFSGLFAVAPGHAYATAVAPAYSPDLNKPDWATACPAASPKSSLTWRAGTSNTTAGASVACTTCDGNNVIVALDGTGHFVFNAATAQDVTAYPPGAWIVLRPFALSMVGIAPPANDNVSTDFPHMSLFVNGTLTVNGNGRMGIGTAAVSGGSTMARFPSVVVTGDLALGASDFAFAGGVYVATGAIGTGNITAGAGGASGNPQFYGPVLADGSITSVGRTLRINYDDELLKIPQTGAIVSPLVARALR